jgi:hypothetical protein
MLAVRWDPGGRFNDLFSSILEQAGIMFHGRHTLYC